MAVKSNQILQELANEGDEIKLPGYTRGRLSLRMLQVRVLAIYIDRLDQDQHDIVMYVPGDVL